MLACLSAAASAQRDSPGRNADFKQTTCPAHMRATALAHRSEIRCAWFSVPEDHHNQRDSAQVHLFVLIILADAPAGKSPLLHLTGGPGDAASDELAFWLESILHQEYDIILVDQRGTGLSQPSLDCPEAYRREGWLLACRERLQNEGVALSAYHSLAIVWDMRALLDAMALEQVNIYSHSFGSRLALLLARVAPESIRSLTLDGAYPPARSAVADMAYNAEQALQQLFRDCKAAPACHDALPGLRRKFFHLHAALNQTPLKLYVAGENATLHMTGDNFMLWTIDMLRIPEALPLLPGAIEALYQGYAEVLPSLDARFRAAREDDTSSHSEGAYLSLLCADALAHDDAENRPPVNPAIAQAFRPLARELLTNCQIWKARPAPEWLAPTRASDVPTLLLSGAYDSVTPPYYAELLGEQLTRAWHFLFPNVGHNVLKALPCASSIMLAFLADPWRQPARACFEHLRPPEFKALREG